MGQAQDPQGGHSKAGLKLGSSQTPECHKEVCYHWSDLNQAELDGSAHFSPWVSMGTIQWLPNWMVKRPIYYSLIHAEQSRRRPLRALWGASGPL